MEHLIQAIEYLSGLWMWLAGAGVGTLSIYRTWRFHGGRVLRSIVLSDNMHGHFGATPGKTLYDEIVSAREVRAVLDIRSQFAEHRIGLAIFRCTPDGRCSGVNNELAEMYGSDRSSFVGYGWSEFVISDDRKRAVAVWEESVRLTAPYEDTYTIRNHREDIQMRIRVRACPVFDERTNEILFYIGTAERVKTK